MENKYEMPVNAVWNAIKQARDSGKDAKYALQEAIRAGEAAEERMRSAFLDEMCSS
jgi:hypothetical protein